MPTLNYTTEIDVAKTVGEIQSMLGDHGADAIAVRYGGTVGVDRHPVAVSFTMQVAHGERAFTLPVDVPAMHRSLQAQLKAKKLQPRYATREQAARVAWRVVKDWLAAQLALVAAGMASLDQVMLPYMHVDGAVTLYERYRETGRAIEGSS